jgi:hypothetical protein
MSKLLVILPGGFHPFHAGHFALYQSAKKAFPDAEVFVAATNDQSERPFPFALKEKLAKLAGVEPGHFIQVKSPFQAKEITQQFNPEEDVLIFVRSEKDRNEPPQAGGTKKDGSPAYFQPYTGKNLQPFSKHAYMAYLPTVEFGPGITSATQIRKAWPTLNDKRKTALVMSLYPAAQKNPKLAQNVVQMFDQVMDPQQVNESKIIRSDIKPKLKGLSFLELDRITESAGKDYDKFERNVVKKLKIKESYNILELFGYYVRSLNESKKIVKENKEVQLKKIFKDFADRTLGNSIESAKIGDKVSLLHLYSLEIPDFKTIVHLDGFLSPKEITDIMDIKGIKHLTFADGTKYPNKDGDIFSTAQTLNMTKLFSNYADAAKSYSFYSLIGDQLSGDLEFKILVDTKKTIKESNLTKKQDYIEEK